MTEKYTLTDIFNYEAITRNYCISKGVNLSPRELIILSSTEDEFNIEYAFYLQFKHTHQIKEFIRTRDPALANSLPFISDDILNEESEYEAKLSRYSFLQKPTIFDILNAAINDKKWDLVFYIYQNESSGLYNFITRIEDEFNAKKDLKNKKFFIVQ